jgi:hypothetical protein
MPALIRSALWVLCSIVFFYEIWGEINSLQAAGQCEPMALFWGWCFCVIAAFPTLGELEELEAVPCGWQQRLV